MRLSAATAAFTFVLAAAAPAAHAQSTGSGSSGSGGSSSTSRSGGASSSSSSPSSSSSSSRSGSASRAGGTPGGSAGRNTLGRAASAGRMAIVRAQTAFTAHDLDGAMAAYREAAREQAERAEGTLGTGVVMAARNDTNGALAAFREAAQQAAGSGDDLTRVRAMQAIGNLLEATRQWDQAITAWNDFVAFAQAHPTIASAANGRARVQAIQARAELDQRYAPVRQRIEERRRQNARGPQQPSGS